MDFHAFLDGLLEDVAVGEFTPEQARYMLFSEDFCYITPDGPVNLLEAVKRVKVKVAGGGYITRRKVGRKDPRRSMAAKRAARKGKAARARAMRNPRSKMKRKRTLQARKRMLGSSRRPSVRRPKRPSVRRPKRPATRRPAVRRTSYRGHHGTKRHGPPRRHPRRY